MWHGCISKKRVIVDSINTPPYWNQYKDLALSANLQAFWSEPIIGENGIVQGTFAIYYSNPGKPREEGLSFFKLSANLAAVVFENDLNRAKLLEANSLLNQTVNEINAEFEKVNLIENSIIHGFKHIEVGMIHINVTVTSTDSEVILNFQDDGCGISKALQHVII